MEFPYILGPNEGNDQLKHRSFHGRRKTRFIDVHDIDYSGTVSDEKQFEFGPADWEDYAWPVKNNDKMDGAPISSLAYNPNAYDPHSYNPHSYNPHAHNPHSNCPRFKRRREFLKRHFQANPELWKRNFEKFRQQKFRNKQTFV